MKIMGLPNWLHWTAWFLKTFVFLLVSIVLIIVLLKVSWYPHTEYSVFTYADPTVMLVFLLLYICATITFCFAISVFFSKANTAATVAGLLWFLSYAPYLFLQQQYDQLSLSTKLFASLGSNTAMAYGFQLMLMFEGTSEGKFDPIPADLSSIHISSGIQWSNVGRPNTPDDSLTLGLINDDASHRHLHLPYGCHIRGGRLSGRIRCFLALVLPVHFLLLVRAPTIHR
jgi:ATP-binding cassette subfamily A (ABC1) protein 3